MNTQSATQEADDLAEHRAHRDALKVLQDADLAPMVGGAYALRAYTGIWRDTKDLDLFLRKDQMDEALDVLAEAGFRVELTDPLWLGKAFRGEYFIDLIFSSGNGIATVDEHWARRAPKLEVLGLDSLIVPVEEIIWSKGFVQERERFDGADIHHLILGMGEKMDWRHLLDRYDPHWHVLFGHLVMFRFAFPGDRKAVPDWVMSELAGRLQAEEQQQPSRPQKLCRGTLVSRQQYRYELADGYQDARELEVDGWPGDRNFPVQRKTEH